MIIKQINKNKFNVLTSKDSPIVLATFRTANEAHNFIVTEKERIQKKVDAERARLIAVANAVKNGSKSGKIGKRAVEDARVITLKAEKNPKVKTSKSYPRFALYVTGMTIGQYLKAGGHRGDIEWDHQRGYIDLSKPVWPDEK